MSFEKNFCPSPWFHMRINNSGTYEYCRWKAPDGQTRINFVRNIANQTPIDFFQNSMSSIRAQLLSGQTLEGCNDCKIMEQNRKVSGRQKQLLKAGVQERYFNKSLLSSPLRQDFDYSQAHHGHTQRTVSDWQIDLGNYCNGGCLFCNPESSSRLAVDFKKLGMIDQVPPNSWCDDTELVKKFVDSLVQSENLQYIHFLGGETLITPGFRTILQALVDHGLASQVIIGFTTNLNTWDSDILELLFEFQQVHLGLSIETLTKINDYVRWPNQQSTTLELLDRWRQVGQQHNWLIQLRTTPNCLTIHDLTTVYDYAWEHYLCVESCNFLADPAFMRINVLPPEYLQGVRQKLQQWINQHQIQDIDPVLNIRNPSWAHEQIVQDVQSYIDYIDQMPDESFRLPDLVKYLKKFESIRNNTVLDYLPQYEQLFRTHGY